MKIVWLLALATVACKFLAGHWPWELLGRGLPSPDLTKARNLLGVGPNANRIEIIEAHKALVTMIHPDRGGTNEQIYEANAARDSLLARLPKSIPE
jgi:DnaJ homolog subfamily C member 19